MSIATALRSWLANQSHMVQNCVACGELHQEPGLCRPCHAQLPLLQSACARCAQPTVGPVELCGRCLKRAPTFNAAWVPFRFRYPIRPLLHAFKFNARLAVGQALAQNWLSAWSAHGPTIQPVAIIPVPLHRSRLSHRGFDQAHEFARVVAHAWTVPLLHDVLVRNRQTIEQAGLARIARRRNVRRAFSVVGSVPEGPILLLDDVMTTGATLDACARALKAAGAGDVWVSALARAGRAR